MSLGRRSIAEMVGTFWLVLGGCGSAVLAAAFPGLGIGFAGVSLAFGLTVLTMAYALGHISGGALQSRRLRRPVAAEAASPAVTSAPTSRRRCSGASLAAGVLYADRHRQRRASARRAASPPTATARIRRAATRWRRLSCELVLTCVFLLVIMGATDSNARPRASPRSRSALR